MARDTSAGSGSSGVTDGADDDLAGHVERFAATARRDGALLYAEICEAVAHDPTVLALMAEAPPDQRRGPLLLLAAVHFLLLGGAEDPLAADYPTVQDARAAAAAGHESDEGSRRGVAPDPGVAGRFVAFCGRHARALAQLVATRSTQTNEVGRGAVLLPALASIEGLGPLALFDLGASAGFNLLFDRWHYRYRPRPPGSSVIDVGDPTSPVTIACELRGRPSARPGRTPAGPPGRSRPPPARPGVGRGPALAARLPVAPRCGPFQAPRRRARGGAADPGRPRLERGDIVDDLDALVGTAPPARRRSCSTAGWPPISRWPSSDGWSGRSRRSPGGGRWCGSSPSLPRSSRACRSQPAPRAGRRGATALVAVAAGADAVVARRLADVHPHGRWLRWWGPETCQQVR